MGCTFEGTARRIELRGEGSTSLVRAEAFENGLAARVVLETARVGSQRPPVTIDAPSGLDPIDLDPAAKAYKVTYEIGPTLRIDVEAGAARSGRFQGELAGAPECADPDGCEVQWDDAKRIALVVHPAEARVAAEAKRGSPIRLTGKFPFINPDPGMAVADRLDYVGLEGADGVLLCDGARTEISSELKWAPGSAESVRVDHGIFVTSDGLRLTVVGSFEPEGAAPPYARWIAVAGAALGLILLVVTLLRRRVRRALQPAPPASKPQLTPAISSPPQASAQPMEDGELVGLVLLTAPEDAPIAAALARHLDPYKKRVFNPHDPRDVRPGADVFTETRRAIERTRAVAVLVSADLFAAPEPWSTLLMLASAGRRERGLLIVPVIARPYAWRETELGGLAPLPKEGTIGSVDNEAALVEVARGLAAVV